MATTQVDAPAKERVRPEKLALVANYAALIKNAKSVYLADYIGLDVAQVSELRKQCRERSITFRVVKNRLFRRATDAAGYPELGEHIRGPIAVAVSLEDEVAPAKVITAFAKENDKPSLRGALVDGVVYSAEEADQLAKLPGLEELRAMIVRLLATPATQLVRVLAAPGTQLARVIDARREQLEKQG